ncbi:hypothetical protein [Streptomyces spectabilis]|uniref:Uncharacterized protein n=1 Tax=Streptomyces spectabilis TaxID=68270 RepID=A0A516R869_STRST|nr:hypothetical protein [Streptomyces spectabilis]QDQ11852.1 hypothetical protein FH965_15775 [Streptomyces spectabilis]
MGTVSDSTDMAEGPVFVDETGRRGRRYRRIGTFVGLACAGYAVVIVATLASGNSSAPWLPVPDPKDEQPASKVDTPNVPAESTGSPDSAPPSGTTPAPGPSRTTSGTAPDRVVVPSGGPGAAVPSRARGGGGPDAPAAPAPKRGGDRQAPPPRPTDGGGTPAPAPTNDPEPPAAEPSQDPEPPAVPPTPSPEGESQSGGDGAGDGAEAGGEADGEAVSGSQPASDASAAPPEEAQP